jgi:hypothetical protein
MVDLKEVRLFVGMPCYGGQLYYSTARSLIQLTDISRQIGMNLTVLFLGNESLVQRARNRLVSDFRAGDFTHLMFIDSDIGFEPLDVIRMLQADLEVVVGAYPKKEIVWELVETALQRGYHGKDLAPFASQHVINFTLVDGKLTVMAMGDDKFVEVKDGATGFMLIKRAVIDKMIDAYPETKYRPDDKEPYGSQPYALFDCIIDDGRYLSEDYTFCRRWQRIGGKAHCFLSARLTHTGTFTFQGHPERVFQAEEPKYDDLPVQFVTATEAAQ